MNSLFSKLLITTSQVHLLTLLIELLANLSKENDTLRKYNAILEEGNIFLKKVSTFVANTLLGYISSFSHSSFLGKLRELKNYLDSRRKPESDQVILAGKVAELLREVLGGAAIQPDHVAALSSVVGESLDQIILSRISLEDLQKRVSEAT